MKVARAILSKKFLDGSHAIEYGEVGGRHIQVTVARDGKGEDKPFLIQRRRNHGAPVTAPLPEWRILRGAGVGRDGYYGSWLPQLNDLLAECVLVPLAADDRPAKKPGDR